MTLNQVTANSYSEGSLVAKVPPSSAPFPQFSVQAGGSGVGFTPGRGVLPSE